MSAQNDGSKPAFSPAVWLFLEAFLILSYAIKASRYRWVFFVPIAATILYSFIFTNMDSLSHFGIPDWVIGYRFSANILFASTNILLCDVQRELRLVDQQGSISVEPFLSRIRWSLIVWANPLATNFVHTPTSSFPPRSAQRTRFAFVVSQLFDISYFLFLHELISFVNGANPYHFQKPFGITSGYKKLWRLLGVFHGLLFYSRLQMGYKLASLVFVSLRITTSRDWPDLFGPWKYAYTLRGFWGKTWHQGIRRATLTHANFLTKLLGIPSRSRLGSLLTLYFGFFLSGVGHYIGEAVGMQSLTRPVGTIHFFLLQAVGITLEDAFLVSLRKIPPDMPKDVNAGRKKHIANSNPKLNLGLPKLFPDRIIGFVWVIFWINLTLPVWADEVYRHGLMKDIRLTSIVWKGLSYILGKVDGV